METKNIPWNIRISKSDKKNFQKLAKRLKVKSQAEAVRRAVEMALESTEKPQQNPVKENDNDSLRGIL